MTALDDARLSALARRSVDVILANQAPTGAYLASPTFPVYRYSWLRDGAFIADAMSRIGAVDSAEAFFGWCARILVERRERIDALVARAAAGEAIAPADHLHTRYTAEGTESDAEWWNFQLDGYGTWLWALGVHRRRHGRSVDAFLDGAIASARYVAAFRSQPSYDWWEEHPDQRHVSTMAAMAAGLVAAATLDGVPLRDAQAFGAAGEALRDEVHAAGTRLGHLPKWLGSSAVDGSLLSVAALFELLPPDDPVVLATVARIEADLVHDGGVHRYLEDTYFGGGEWLLLAAFLGLQYLATGRVADARTQLEWIATRADASGHLPEQVSDHLLAPARRQEWLDRWGPVASPLVWSHAMYLSLAHGLGVEVPPMQAAR